MRRNIWQGSNELDYSGDHGVMAILVGFEQRARWRDPFRLNVGEIDPDWRTVMFSGEMMDDF